MQVKNAGNFNEGSGDGAGKKCSDSGYILKKKVRKALGYKKREQSRMNPK